MSILKSSPSPQQEPKLSEYGEAFLDFLQEKKVRSIDLSRIRFACEKIESDFKKAKKVRKNGESYESHPYEVTRLYIEFTGVALTTDILIACLLHDHIEDISQETYASISKNFSPHIAFLVHLLSKPPIENNIILSKEDIRILKDSRNRTFFENFKSIPALTSYIELEAQKLGYSLSQQAKKGIQHRTLDIVRIIASIKICDRIHNLYTIEDFSLKEIHRKVEETEEYLVPLAHELCREDTKMLDMLRKSLITVIRIVHRKTATEILSKIS